MEKQKKIIYIAGYGRSGSTLLERILSSNQKIFGLGELKYLLNTIDDSESYCSCGKKIKKCMFWSNVIKEISQENNFSKLKNFRCKFESISQFFNHLFNLSDKAIYKNFINNLFNSIFEHSPSGVEYIIDSSKTARDAFFRPFILSDSFSVKVIHLVRDGRGCMWSNLKGSNRKMEQGVDPTLPFAALRTALSWPLANTSAHIFQLLNSKENYCRVKYEDFVEQPDKILNKIGVFLNVNLNEQINMLRNKEDVPLGHQLAGNRLRKKQKIILKKDIEWKRKLKLRYKILFWILDWPLALFYNDR